MPQVITIIGSSAGGGDDGTAEVPQGHHHHRRRSSGDGTVSLLSLRLRRLWWLRTLAAYCSRSGSAAGAPRLSPRGGGGGGFGGGGFGGDSTVSLLSLQLRQFRRLRTPAACCPRSGSAVAWPSYGRTYYQCIKTPVPVLNAVPREVPYQVRLRAVNSAINTFRVLRAPKFWGCQLQGMGRQEIGAGVMFYHILPRPRAGIPYLPREFTSIA